MKRTALIGVLVMALCGCEGAKRHVVVDPAGSGSRNSADWTVQREPSPAPAPQ